MHELIEHIENNMLEINEGLGDATVKGIGMVGGAVGSLAARVTSEKKNWSIAVKQHEIVKERLSKRPNDISLQKREKLAKRKKAAAYLKYENLRMKYKHKAKASSSNTATAIGKRASAVGKSIASRAPAVKNAVTKGAQNVKNAASKVGSVGGILPGVHNYIKSTYHR